MKVAVTLATGQLGRAISKELVDQIGSDNVIGMARSPEKGSDLGIEIRKGDYDQPTDFINGLSNADVVICVSGNTKPEDRIQQHQNVINGAKANGVKKMVYVSILGSPDDTGFGPIVKSNRQSEQDVIASGMDYAIGRNGIYLEPDLEYIEQYRVNGKITNCAAKGKCAYTSRDELATAYAKLAIDENFENGVYNLCGEAITQHQLAEKLNLHFDTNLTYESMSIKAYEEERSAALGPFLGQIIAGIYDSVSKGYFDEPSDFEKVVGRLHLSVDELMKNFKNQQN